MEKPRYLSILMEVQLQRLNIFLKSQCAHCPYEVIPIDRFPFLPLTLVTCPAERGRPCILLSIARQ